MRKLKVVICSALFSAASLTGVSSAYAEAEANTAALPDASTPAAPEGAAAPEPSVPDAGTPEVSSPEATTAQPVAADPYAVKSFFADFTHFTLGDNVPELYRSKKYEVVQWKVRNLPAPVADSHWTYMGGNYVMITNVDGKILKAESGEIYYKH